MTGELDPMVRTVINESVSTLYRVLRAELANG